VASYPDIYVIRHGQTEWNVVNRYQGHLDSPLTNLGRAQALAVGRTLLRELGHHPDLSAFTSPQGRAADSAALILGDLGLSAKTDERLQEIAFGRWEGLTLEKILSGWPDKAAMAATEPFLWHFQAPGGERLAALKTRCRAFLKDLSGPSIVVTHGVTSRMLRGIWLGLEDRETAMLPGGQGVIYHLGAACGHRAIKTDAFAPSLNG